MISEEHKQQHDAASSKHETFEEKAELLGELLDLVKETTQQIDVLSWVALTFGRLGVSSDVLGPGVRDDKQKFFLTQSGKTIEQILLSSELQRDAQTSWRRELITVRSSLGQWSEAVKQMQIILSDT